MAIKKGDFIVLDYTGSVKTTNAVFDTTNKAAAEKSGINAAVQQITICVGEKYVLGGLDETLEGKEEGKELEVDVPAAKGFGLRDPKFVQLTSLSKFKDQNVMPVPGMQFDLNGAITTVRSVSGGRVILDFNHPLAGKDLHYKFKIVKKVEDLKEKLACLVNYLIPFSKVQELKIEEGKAHIKFEKDAPKPFLERLKTDAKRLLPEIKELSFAEKEKPSSTGHKK